ncbi:MAG TPA: hypothetical protein VGJ55_04885 [Pyrinomonadaceae bacterium]|jgi:hypothetical protein
MKRTVFFSLLIIAVAGSLLVGVGFPQAQQRKVDSVDDSALNQQTNQKEAGKADDEKMPESWRGTWKVTVAYRDHETGALVATDVTTAEMCPGELIIPDLAIKSLNCSANADDNEIGALCSAKYSPRPGCNVFVNAGLDSQRDGETWHGTGGWTAKVVGNCEHISFGEDFTVSGTRVSNEATCFGAKSNLVSRFFAHPELIRFLAEGTQGESHDKK